MSEANVRCEKERPTPLSMPFTDTSAICLYDSYCIRYGHPACHLIAETRVREVIEQAGQPGMNTCRQPRFLLFGRGGRELVCSSPSTVLLLLPSATPPPSPS
eukprot:GHVU01119289.1.p2 GENE.GHVU01119289.1~~GHVU01119289.1.p2  ORF type:complete len:102 (-),score=5.31 GHVU01119289.1:3-308(-)